MNTAVLTGRQVSQPLKIFIVSDAGKIADVTLHTSCHTNDDSALKVSGYQYLWPQMKPRILEYLYKTARTYPIF